MTWNTLLPSIKQLNLSNDSKKSTVWSITFIHFISSFTNLIVINCFIIIILFPFNCSQRIIYSCLLYSCKNHHQILLWNPLFLYCTSPQVILLSVYRHPPYQEEVASIYAVQGVPKGMTEFLTMGRTCETDNISPTKEFPWKHT